MSDGAHLGVGAGRAIKTILGGKPSPGPEEQNTREQVRAKIMAAPTPADPPPWKSGVGGEAYENAANAIARAFLTVRAENPALPLEMDAMWDAVKKKWPRFDDWLGGASGFQVGWATNCVRWLEAEPPAANPAIVHL